MQVRVIFLALTLVYPINALISSLLGARAARQPRPLRGLLPQLVLRCKEGRGLFGSEGLLHWRSVRAAGPGCGLVLVRLFPAIIFLGVEA